MSDDALAARMGEIARTLLGEPNPRHSSGTDLRYGTNGSLSIDPDSGVWFDHESAEGGGVLDLLARQGLQNGSALDWLRDRGFLPPRDADRAPRPALGPRVAVATYDYIDEHGEVVFQVVRYEPKTFRQRRRARPDDDPKDIRDGWVWSVKGIPLVPYRLPELLEDLAADRAVMIVEGEKDVDALRLRGIPATCNPMGAGKWSADLDRHFLGADVIILPDNDEPGRKHRDLVAGRLAGIASRVRSLDLPGLSPKGDAADWLDAGGSAEELYHLVETRARAPGDAPPASRFGALWLDAIPGTGNIAPWIVKGNHLRAVPAAVRFLSIEPLLEDLGKINLYGIHLVIVGGESGPGARPLHPAWVRSLREQCAAQGAAFFFKQWGDWHPADQVKNREQINAGGDMGRALRDGRAYAFEDQWTWRLGKKAAGRLLDGVEHNGMPEVRHG